MNKLYARRDRGMWQVDRRTRGQGNMLLVVEDMVTGEQVRGVTERGECAGDGKRAGCGQKGSGMGAEGEWAGNGRCVEWGWDGCGLGEEGKWVGEWKACEGEEYFILM